MQISKTIPVISYLFEVHRVVWISLISVAIVIVVGYVNIDRSMETGNSLVKESFLRTFFCWVKALSFDHVQEAVFLIDRHPHIAAVISSITLLILLQVNKYILPILSPFIHSLTPLAVLSEILITLGLLFHILSTKAIKIN